MNRYVRTTAGVIAVVLLCASLGSDQARYLPWLKVFAEDSDTPQYSWYQAALAGDEEAGNQLLEFATRQKQPYWLSLLFSLGSLEALYNLALLQSDNSLQKQMLGQGAQAGHAPSQYELSLVSQSSSARLLWLQKAAGAGHLLAQIALYQWHLLHDDVDNALPWLKEAASQDAQSALLYGKMLWKQRDYAGAKSHFQLAIQFGEPSASEYLHHINTYWKKNTNISDRLQVERPQCHMRLQFVANSLESMIQATDFQRRFNQDKRLASLPICLNSPIWVDQLSCSDNWQGKHRLGCNESPLLEVAETREMSHVVIFAQQGKANVNNGVMYLDLADTYSVFVHELAHFAGFIDEYPLSTPMAQVHCRLESAPNLIVVEDDTLPAMEDMENWLQYSYDVGLAKARTCNNHSFQAYKPTRDLTFMEYHDQGIIPKLYLRLWLERLQDPSNLTPVYVNFAQMLQRQGKEEQAKHWWQAFENYRNLL